jgi:hypothetical protein
VSEGLMLKDGLKPKKEPKFGASNVVIVPSGARRKPPAEPTPAIAPAGLMLEGEVAVPSNVVKAPSGARRKP